MADFYALLMAALDRAGVPVTITERPSEVPNPIPFPEDVEHTSYDPEPVTRFWRALVSVDAVLKEHRARFLGRVSPVQFFWGTFDLAYTRFSGRPAEPPPDADVIMRNSANAEEACAGFWPGDERFPEPAFFAYTYPRPPGIEARGRGLERRDGPVRSALRSGPDRARPAPRAARLPREHVRRARAGIRLWRPKRRNKRRPRVVLSSTRAETQILWRSLGAHASPAKGAHNEGQAP